MSSRRAAHPTPLPRPPLALPAYPKLQPRVAQELHYAGDRRAAVGQVMGPNAFGEKLTVVTAAYDADLDRTTLGLAYGIHPVALGSAALTAPPAPLDVQ